jgi:hypothetical protein
MENTLENHYKRAVLVMVMIDQKDPITFTPEQIAYYKHIYERGRPPTYLEQIDDARFLVDYLQKEYNLHGMNLMDAASRAIS